MACLSLAAGCSAHTSTLEIIDYREPGVAQAYRETFDEAYYCLDEHGNVDIVLRRRDRSASPRRQNVLQIVHIRSFWRPIPGRTVAHRTQINGTVSYGIVSGNIGATFEGAGSVFFTQHRSKDVLTGRVDQATLHQERSITAETGLFERARLSGEFRAVRNRRRVVRIINELQRLFGALTPNKTRHKGGVGDLADHRDDNARDAYHANTRWSTAPGYPKRRTE